MIKVRDYVEHAFSAKDAEKLLAVVQPLVETDNKIVVDFEGIRFFTALFFNNVFAQFVVDLTPKVYCEKFELQSLSEVGAATYKHSFDNAVEYVAQIEERN